MSESIATALREGLTNELIRQKFARLLCGAAAMDAATTDEWREYISSALTPVVERLLRDRDLVIFQLDRALDAANTRATEAERRLREIRKQVEALTMIDNASDTSDEAQFVKGNNDAVAEVLALLDTGAGTQEK